MKLKASLATCLFFSLFVLNLCDAQEAFLKDVADSVLADTKKEMGDLVQLSVIDGKLTLLKNWDLIDAREKIDEPKDERIEAEIKKWIDRGLPEERAREMIARRGSSSQPGVAKQLRKLNNKVPGSRGSGSSSSGKDQWNYRFRGEELSSRVSNWDGRLQIHLETADNVEVTFKETADSFELRLLSDSGIFYLQQRSKNFQLSIIRGGEAKVWLGENYEAFLEKHSAVFESEIRPVLDGLGIESPHNVSDELVCGVALEILQAHENDLMKVQGLLDGLKSDSLSDREASYEALLEGYYKWHWLIDDLKSMYEFDEESKLKFAKILKAAPGTPIQDYLRLLDVVNNKQALLRIIKATPEEKSIPALRRLCELTGKSLGHDVEAWTELLEGE